ncbi:putative armadillo-like helical, coatomer beta subunit (COPB1) protein [Helianthus annuus]|nr:putative armadillo-like helical, coatomer beta subunit (COPB1) protein [Helianthus annuus]
MEKSCSLLIHFDKGTPALANEIKEALEGNNDAANDDAPYVRRNAIFAVNVIYKLPQGDNLLVDAPEMIEKMLTTEADQSAKRNVFLMLYTCAQDRNAILVVNAFLVMVFITRLFELRCSLCLNGYDYLLFVHKMF